MRTPTPPRPALRSTLPLWVAINDEWQFLIHSATANRELARWHRLHPQLRAAPHLADLKAAIDTDPDLLAPLVRLYQDGSQLAAKALIYAMLGKLVRLSRHARIRSAGTHADRDERASLTTAAFLDIARTQNLDSTNIAAALALRTLSAIQSHNTFDREVCTEDDVADHFANNTAPIPEIDAHTHAQTLVDDAHTHGHISAAEHALLTAAYLTDTHRTQAELADQLGISHPALRRRLSRAVAHLRDATHYAAAS